MEEKALPEQFLSCKMQAMRKNNICMRKTNTYGKWCNYV